MSEFGVIAHLDGDTIYRTVEYTRQYGVALQAARRLRSGERPHAKDRDKIFLGLGDAFVPGAILSHLRKEDMTARPADGAFPGCKNCAWIISEAEWADLEALERSRASAHASAQLQRAIEQLQQRKQEMEWMAEHQPGKVLPSKAELEKAPKRAFVYSMEAYQQTCQKLESLLKRRGM